MSSLSEIADLESQVKEGFLEAVDTLIDGYD